MANLGKSVKGKSHLAKKAPPKEAKAATRTRTFQQSDLAKAQARRLRREMAKNLQDEMKMAHSNRLKVQNAWIKIMRIAKTESLRKDIEVLSQSHERDVDRKDALLQMLDRDLDEAEEQYQIALRQHLRHIDKLIETQDDRIAALEDEFAADLEALDKEFHEERTEVVSKHDGDVLELRSIIARVSEEESEKFADMKQEFEATLEESRTRNLELVNSLAASLDLTIEELQKEFETAHLNYLQQTDSTTQEYKHLSLLDKSATKAIEDQLKSIEKLQGSVEYWKSRIGANEKEYTEKNQQMSEEKESMLSHSRTLKKRMANMRQQAERKLTQLSVAVEEVTISLRQNLELGQRVLGLAERSRTLETESEKVFPFPVPLADSTAMESTSDLAAQLDAGGVSSLSGFDSAVAEAEGLCQITPEELSALKLFHRRYNKVLIDKLVMDRERSRLAQENEDIKSLLQQFLAGVSVSGTTVDAANSLLIVNGRTNVVGKLPVQVAPPTVIEANHMVATGRVMPARK